MQESTLESMVDLQASTIWEAQGDEKRTQVQQMFATIAPSYDSVNGLMSLNQHQNWRRLALSKILLQPNQIVVDLCCGTGDFLPLIREAVGTQGSVIGVDFCSPMLLQARTKLSNPDLILGDGNQLPIASEVADAVTVGWGIRNVPNIDQTHEEIYRILKSGGRFVSIDCSDPAHPVLKFATRLLRGRILTAIGSVFGFRNAYQYLDESTKRFKTRQELKASMESAGFVEVNYQDLMLGNICIHWGTKP